MRQGRENPSLRFLERLEVVVAGHKGAVAS